jgi:hypothetical protein
MMPGGVFTLLLILIAGVLFAYKPTRLFIGKEENHNAAIVLITFVGFVVALPLFSRQINNIQIKVDAIEATVRSIYGSFVRESFSYEDLKNNFSESSFGNVVQIKLKHAPVANSVSVWEGSANIPPQYLHLVDNILSVETNNSAQTFEQYAKLYPDFEYVVTYIPDTSK